MHAETSKPTRSLYNTQDIHWSLDPVAPSWRRLGILWSNNENKSESRWHTPEEEDRRTQQKGHLWRACGRPSIAQTASQEQKEKPPLSTSIEEPGMFKYTLIAFKGQASKLTYHSLWMSLLIIPDAKYFYWRYLLSTYLCTRRSSLVKWNRGVLEKCLAKHMKIKRIWTSRRVCLK